MITYNGKIEKLLTSASKYINDLKITDGILKTLPSQRV